MLIAGNNVNSVYTDSLYPTCRLLNPKPLFLSLCSMHSPQVDTPSVASCLWLPDRLITQMKRTQLISAIHTILRGDLYVDPSMARILLSDESSAIVAPSQST